MGQGEEGYELPKGFDEWELEERMVFLDSLVGYESQTYWEYTRPALMGYQLAEENEEYGWLAKFSTSLSKKYREAGLYEESKSYAMKGVEAARRGGDRGAESNALTRLAGCNNELGLADLAHQNAIEALEIGRELKDSVAVGWALNIRGEVYRLNDDPERALPWYQKAYSAFSSVGYEFGTHVTQHNLGVNYVALGEVELAQEWFEKPISEEFGENNLRIFEYEMAQSQLLQLTGQLDSAVAQGETYLKMASELTPKWHVKWLDRLAELERQRGNLDMAWNYRDRGSALQERILGENVKTKSSMMDVQFELRDAKAKNLLLEQENKTQRLVTISLFVILGLILGLALVFVQANRRIRRQSGVINRRNDQLDVLVKEKDMLMNIMAHDLKSPLSSISGLLDLIESPETPPEVRDKTIRHIRRSLAKGTEIISSLLDLAALEANKVQSKVEHFSLNGVLQEVREDFQAQAEQKDIAIDLEMPAEEVAIDSDPKLVKRLVDNLVSNAIKYSPAGSPVALQLVPKADVVRVSVVDHGVGIPKSEQGMLFKKFQKLSSRPTAGESSTGLGLSIVKKLAEQLGGELDVESEVGKGSVFSIELPIT